MLRLIFSAVLSVTFIARTCIADKTTTPRPVIDLACTSNNDCSYPQTYCKVESPSCGKGVCRCIPGYAYDGTSQCRRAIAGVGTKCDPDQDVCTGRNVTCDQSTETCTCPANYMPGLEGDCIPTIMTKASGDACGDDAQCYYSLHCFDNKCGCFAGYKVSNKTRCVKKEPGDACSSQDDCQFAAHSTCSNGVCSCLPGYTQITYWTGVGKQSTVGNHNTYYTDDVAIKHKACMNKKDNLKGEGVTCTPADNSYADSTSPQIRGSKWTEGESTTQATSDMPGYCKQPYICSSCGKPDSNSDDRYVCAIHQMPVMSASYRISPAVSLILVATALPLLRLNF